MDPEEKRKQLETDILKIIEEKLSKGQMTADRAQAISRMVLEKLHPPLTLEQIYPVAPSLDDEFRELSNAVIPVLKEHDDKIREVVSKHAETLIKSGKIQEASDVLKNAIDN
jgi:hypothetical protein